MSPRRVTALLALAVAGCLPWSLGAVASAADSSIQANASSNCAGADSWVATYVIGVSSVSPDETWHLVEPDGFEVSRSVNDVVVVERVQSMDQASADLGVVATLEQVEITLSTTVTVARPAICTSAPPPPVDPGPVGSGGLDQQAAQPVTPPGVATAGSPTGYAPASRLFTGSEVASVVPAVVPSVMPRAQELPATGSTSGVLVALAASWSVAGLVLLRLSRAPVLASTTNTRSLRDPTDSTEMVDT